MGNEIFEIFDGASKDIFCVETKTGGTTLQLAMVNVNPVQQLHEQNGEQLSESLCSSCLVDFEISGNFF